jgi:hypothetical protein
LRVALPFQPGDLIDIESAPNIPSVDAVKSGKAGTLSLPKTAIALVLCGDRLDNSFSFTSIGQTGELLHATVLMTKTQVRAI